MGEQHFTTDDGCKIFWRQDGDRSAPALLLSNSLGTDSRLWQSQMDIFAQHFNVIRYDTRGHGQSDAPTGGYSLDRLGRDVVQLLDHLQTGSSWPTHRPIWGRRRAGQTGSIVC